MFQTKKLEKFNNININKTATSLFGRPLMWVYFQEVDNFFIDTGTSNCNQSQLLKYIKEKDTGEDRIILNTHLHEDHCGNNLLFQKNLNTKIFAPDPEGKSNFNEVDLLYRIYWGKPKIFDYTQLRQDTIETSRGRKIRIIPTPGHTPYHVCYYLEDDDILITGDAIPLASKKTYSMPEENYKQIIKTLKMLREFIGSGTTVITAHQETLADPKKVITERVNKMEDVVEQVHTAWGSKAEDLSTVADIIFGKRLVYDYIVGPRMSLEDTVRSIIFD
ncbi:MAG: MBL fold metallo-hydrolase [bacterium]|nr:MBL fold metallo-hydrolase [bacterium]